MNASNFRFLASFIIFIKLIPELKLRAKSFNVLLMYYLTLSEQTN